MIRPARAHASTSSTGAVLVSISSSGSHASDTLRVAPGETTEDGVFSLNEARCLGACGQAPVVMVNEQVHAKVTPEQVPDILAHYIAESQAA